MIGTTIGHYTITDRVEFGSLGEAWLATDTALKRRVLLKVLPAELASEGTIRELFLQEARSAGALEHPNIACVHEAGELPDGRVWLAVAWSGGLSLRQKISGGPLAVEEAVEIAIQIGRGLAKAHEAGVVHLDVTPEDVVVGDDGQVKIFDFTVARLAASEQLTQNGARAGTAGYLSPGQAAGRETCGSSDIRKLGVVLYEMIAGIHPFEGSSAQDVIDRVLDADVRDRSGRVPREVGRIIGRALGREPSQRYGSMADMVADLEQVAGMISSRTLFKRMGVKVPRTRPKRRMLAGIAAAAAVVVVAAAVGGYLPWRERSAAAGGEGGVMLALLPIASGAGIADGDMLPEVLTDGLMTDLVKIRGLRVISQTSARQIRWDEQIAQVGEKLGVDCVLKGTLGRDGDRVRLALELWRVKGEQRIWEREYFDAPADLAALAAEAAQEAARRSGVTVTKEDRRRIAVKRVVKQEAHALYLKARRLQEDQWNPEHIVKGIEYYRKALELEPEYAEAWGYLAVEYATAFFLGVDGPDADKKKDEAMARAMAIDPDSADTNVAAAWVNGFKADSGRLSATTAALDKALAADPNHIMAHVLYADLIVSWKRFDEAIAHVQTAVKLDPLSVPAVTELALCYYFSRRFAEAVPVFQKLMELAPDNTLNVRNYGLTLVELGRYDAGIQLLSQAAALGGLSVETCLGYGYARKGDRAAARNIVEKLTKEYDAKVYPYGAVDIGMIYANIGELKLAMKWLLEGEKAGLPINFMEPSWDPLRSIPEFKEMVKRSGQPE